MINRIVVPALMLLFCSFGVATAAGWLNDAVDNAVERTGTRAVDDAADSVYESSRDRLTGDREPDTRRGASPAPRQSQGRQISAPSRGDDDEHFIQPDDYFIADHALGNEAWMYVRLAKMVKEPTPQTKGQGEFFQITDGRKVWTKYFWQTRAATERDVKPGAMVIMMDGKAEDSVYLPPDTKEEARGNAWFMAKVTDMTDLYKNYITVSGNYKIDLRNLRVIIKK